MSRFRQNIGSSCALAAALCFGLSGAARAQVDTSRRPLPRPDTSVIIAFPSSEDVEDIPVPKGRLGMAGYLMGPKQRRRMLDTLDAHRLVWDRRRPTAYLIRVLSISDCIEVRTGKRAPGEMRRRRLVVRDTAIVRREAAPIPAVYEQRCLLDMRVDDLFAEVRGALADATAYVPSVEYDQAYGFPRAYRITRGYDRGAGVLVESFAPEP